MKTHDSKYFKHLAKARTVSNNLEGILYQGKDKTWYLFHNTKEVSGGSPSEFEDVKGRYGYINCWYLAGHESSSDYEVELLDEPSPKSKKEIRDEIRAEKRAEQKAKDVKTIFGGEPEICEESEKITDVSKFISGAEVIFSKKSSLGEINSSPGQLYYCSDEKTWFFLSNSNFFCGDKPQVGWIGLKERTGFEYSFSITTRGKSELYYKGSYIKFLSVPRASEPEPEPEKLKEHIESINIDYSSLEEGAEVLFAVDEIGYPSRRLPTRGKLFKESDTCDRWYILHNDNNKTGARPSKSLSSIFDGEFEYSWQIGTPRTPYTKLIRLDILSRPKEKIVDVPKDRFAVGCEITCLTPEQFETKLKRKIFAHSGIFERYAGKKAKVYRIGSEKEIGVTWHDGVNYSMAKEEFQEFYPEYLGRVVTIEDPAPTPEPTKKEEPKVRTPLFPTGMVLTCLTAEQFRDKLGRVKFYHGGEFDRLAGKKCTVISQTSEAYVNVRWNDYSTHSYKMNVNEFKEYYPELRETTVTAGSTIDPTKITVVSTGWAGTHIPEDSGSGWKVMSATMGKFATPDHVVTLGSMGIPKDRIDAFAHSIDAITDGFKPDASYKYTPPVHPSSSKLRATSDSDIKGDSVPRKKNIDTLLILGL